MQKFWDPNVCFNFLENFLTYVKRCLKREIRHKYGENALHKIHSLPLTSLHFEWEPGTPVRVTDNYVHEDDPILHSWFTENFMTYRYDEWPSIWSLPNCRICCKNYCYVIINTVRILIFLRPYLFHFMFRFSNGK